MDNKINKLLKIKIIFALVLVLIVSNALFTVNNQFDDDSVAMSKAHQTLINKSNEVKTLFYLINETLTLCDNPEVQCKNESISILGEQLGMEVIHFRDLVAAEKELISTAGLLDLDYISLYLKKYKLHQNDQLLHLELKSSVVKLNRISDNLEIILHYKLNIEARNNLILIIALNFIILALFVFGTFLALKHNKQLKAEKDQFAHTFNFILNDVKELNHQSLINRISNVNTDPSEKKIYSMLLYSFEKLEDEKSKTDLYQRLYSLLGNEIRGITNTIQGGIDLLFEDEDLQKALQAKEVVTATRTLENLAENFNLLSIVDVSTGDKAINFNDLASELIVLLATKAKVRNKTIESYVSNSIPVKFYGHQTGIFWILLMQISDTISSSAAKKVLFTIECTPSHRVDKLQINIDIFLYEQEIASMEDMKNLPWGTIPKKVITNKLLVETLLGRGKNYQVIQKTLDDNSRVRISFDINPAEYQAENNLLIGKKILLCGASNMQVDVIEKMLLDQGAEVIIASTPNDIFKKLSVLSPQDGIFLTNNIPGVNLQSFCKIIQSRIKKQNIKMFLSFSTTDVDKKLYEYIDYIFYHPCPPTNFISSIVEHLNQEESKEDVEESDKILIVEDDKLQQFMLKKILTDLGFDCDTADDGKEALTAFEFHDYKAIFMDCLMPNMDGLEATEEIRRLEAESGENPIVIIGATALTSNQELTKCVESGMNYAIHKPYKKAEIFTVLKKYLSIKKVV